VASKTTVSVRPLVWIDATARCAPAEVPSRQTAAVWPVGSLVVAADDVIEPPPVSITQVTVAPP